MTGGVEFPMTSFKVEYRRRDPITREWGNRHEVRCGTEDEAREFVAETAAEIGSKVTGLFVWSDEAEDWAELPVTVE